jgi:hypothetical protein
MQSRRLTENAESWEWSQALSIVVIITMVGFRDEQGPVG